MDTLTHAVIGALVVRTPNPSFFTGSGFSEAGRVAIVTAASAFPDLDYASFGIDPYQFITHWHRGITHSLLFLPVWAVLLGCFFSVAANRTDRCRETILLCGLGLLLHVVADLITVYGTQIFSPLSDYRISLGLTFDMDFWVALIAAASLGLSFYRRIFARYGIVFLGFYLGLVLIAQISAIRIAENRHPAVSVESIHAIPHPLSPLHRILVIETFSGYWLAHLDLSGLGIWLKDFDPTDRCGLGRYTSKNTLLWEWQLKPGRAVPGREIAKEVWHQAKMKPFRRFARLPVLYWIDRDRHAVCVWFTDLRYVIPRIIPPFRYGMCRDRPESDWQVYRLKRFTQADREVLN